MSVGLEKNGTQGKGVYNPTISTFFFLPYAHVKSSQQFILGHQQEAPNSTDNHFQSFPCFFLSLDKRIFFFFVLHLLNSHLMLLFSLPNLSSRESLLSSSPCVVCHYQLSLLCLFPYFLFVCVVLFCFVQ